MIPASAIKVLTHHECWMPRTYGTIFVSLVSYRLSSISSLQWRHSEPDGVSNHQPHICLPNRLFGHRSKKTSKLRVTGLCEGNSPETGEFPAQRVSNAEIVSIWWRHHFEDLWVAWHLWHGEANHLFTPFVYTTVYVLCNIITYLRYLYTSLFVNILLWCFSSVNTYEKCQGWGSLEIPLVTGMLLIFVGISQPHYTPIWQMCPQSWRHFSNINVVFNRKSSC